MGKLVKEQIAVLAAMLELHQYNEGTLLDLANYDLKIQYCGRNIYGDYPADVAAVYSQYINLSKRKVA
jgi:hypothetical protein